MTAGYPGVQGVLQHGYWGVLGGKGGGTGTGVREVLWSKRGTKGTGGTAG